MTLNEARELANINERAKTLFSTGGYWYEPMEGCAETFYVHRNGDPVWVWLLVTVGERASCPCPSFEKHDLCKHVLALENELADAARYEAAAAAQEEWETYGKHCLAAGKF